MLPLNVPRSSVIGATTDTANNSNYYTFTTTSNGTATVLVASPTSLLGLLHDLYSDINYTTQVGGRDTDSGFTSPSLLAGTYYLKVTRDIGPKLYYVIKVTTP